MAVTDCFLNGTISSGTTIQPASGTIYSFKRGKINIASGGNSFSLVHNGGSGPSVTQWGLYQSSGAGTTSTTYVSTANFTFYQFSESGITCNGPSQGYAVNSAGGSPFAAISNSNTIQILTYTTTYYTLVGVSMT